MKNYKINIFKVIKMFIRVVLFLAICVVQFFIFKFIFFDMVKGNEVLSFVMNILAVIFVVQIYRRKDNISYKMLWIIFILLVPFIGAMFYLLFGKGKTLPKSKYNKITKYLNGKIPCNEEELENLYREDLTVAKMAKLVQNTSGYPVYQNSGSEFYPSGEEKFVALLRDIERATKYVFIEYFIIAEGGLWEKIKAALVERANAGVEVKIIYDAAGSQFTINPYSVFELNQIPNLKIVAYNPMGMNLKLSFNYRDHRKIVVIDGLVSYVGGINIGDEYVNKKLRFGHWRDNALRITGDAVKSFILLFSENWYMSTLETLEVEHYYAKKVDKLLADKSSHGDGDARIAASDNSLPCEQEKEALTIHPNQGYILPFGDGPTNQYNPSYELFQSMLDNSKKYAYISTPYFIIDQGFIDTISMAAKSGVDVRILLPKVPDKKIVFFMTRGHYRDVLEAGAKIYEYSPGFNHAKSVVCDDTYGFLGTVNIDYRSMLLHFECGAFMAHTDSLLAIKEDFLEALKVSEEITLKSWKKRPLFNRVFEWVLALLSPLM